ncbi:hypothetical protein CPC08DRAFT_822229 [Agrocybe pediades]|nr:hypothetical protein CPC08DRAFT_822229 [Agrocybe pediades]
MFPTLSRLSKASRQSLTPKRGNKDYYKGTRQAFLPGGRRTGAPGKHVVRGKAKYRLVDEQVRVYVAPPLEMINNSELKPYVSLSTKLTPEETTAVFSKFRSSKGLSPSHFLRVAREHTLAAKDAQAFTALEPERLPVWMKAQNKLGIQDVPADTPGLVLKDGAAGAQVPAPRVQGSVMSKVSSEGPRKAPVRELEVVS